MKPLENTSIVRPKKHVHGFQPIYYFSRYIGLWPFTIIYSSDESFKKAHVYLFDILWFFTSISLYLSSIFFLYLDLKNSLDPNDSFYVSNLVYYIFQIPQLFFGAVGIVVDMYNRNNIVNILRKFTIFDKEICKFGISFNYKNENRRTLLYLLLPTLSTIPLIMFDIAVYNPDWETNLTFLKWAIPELLRTVACVLVSMSFVILIRSLYIRFATLNSLLRNRFLNGDKLKLSARIYIKDSIDFIKFIGHEHAFLTDIADGLNVCYSFQILFNTAATFMYAVYTFYGYSQFIIQIGMISVSASCSQTGWLILFTFATMTIIYYSSLLTNEGRRTFRIVHDIVNRCNNSDMIKALSQLSKQIQNRSPIVSCGLFTYDWPLLSTMVDAIVTYLIIILNFNISTK